MGGLYHQTIGGDSLKTWGLTLQKMGVNNLTWISKGHIQDVCQFGGRRSGPFVIEARSVIECCESTSIQRNQRNCKVHILSVLNIPIPGSHQLWPMLATCIRMPKFSIFSHPTHSSNVLICKIRLGRLNWSPNALAQEINHDNSKILYQYQSAWLIYFHTFHNADRDSFFWFSVIEYSIYPWADWISLEQFQYFQTSSFGLFWRRGIPWICLFITIFLSKKAICWGVRRTHVIWLATLIPWDLIISYPHSGWFHPNYPLVN